MLDSAISIYAGKPGNLMTAATLAKLLPNVAFLQKPFAMRHGLLIVDYSLWTG